MTAIECADCGWDGLRKIKTRNRLITITCPAGHREALSQDDLDHARWWQRLQQSAADTAKDAVREAQRKAATRAITQPMSATSGAERAARERNLAIRLRAHRVMKTDQTPCKRCGGGNPNLGCEDEDVCRCGSDWGSTLAERCAAHARRTA